MTTIDTDVFLQKVASDVGTLSSGGVPSVHIVPHVPGMGILASLKVAATVAEREMLGTGRVVELDQMMGDVIGLSGGALTANNSDTLTDAGIVIIDCAVSTRSVDEQIQILNDTLPSLEGKASVWLVTSNSREFERGLKVDTDALSFRYKSKLGSMNEIDPIAGTSGPKPGP